ncbi:MAG: hypothetical protein J6T81_08670 [Bacteroidales bacterium]|nr:hypothetical protein [Bacteroidales bacterium]
MKKLFLIFRTFVVLGLFHICVLSYAQNYFYAYDYVNRGQAKNVTAYLGSYGSWTQGVGNYYRFYNIDDIYKDIHSLIPLFGKTNGVLTLNVYSATQYYGKWMKETEYPKKTYQITYDSMGMLYSITCSEDDYVQYYVYSYDNSVQGYVLQQVNIYHVSTGASSGYINLSNRMRNFDGDCYDRTFNNNDKLYMFLNAGRQDHLNDHGWKAEVYAYGYNTNNQSYQVAYLSEVRKAKKYMDKVFGKVWPKYANMKLLLGYIDEYDLMINNCNRAGLPMGNGMGNVNAYMLDYIVRNKEYYEYKWNY